MGGHRHPEECTAMTLTVAPAVLAQPAGPPGAALLRQLTGRYDGPADLGDQLRLAEALATARGAIPPMYQNNSGDVLALIYQAKALDVPVIVAMQNFTFNRGRGGMSGSLMQGLIIRAGHRIEYVAATDQHAEMVLHRCDHQPGGKARWTLAEAAVAKLTTKEVWIAYPGDLLFWRCLSRLARRFASDVVQGFGYTPEELTAITVDDVEDGLAERPVDPDVQEFLADLDTLDADAARAKWKEARKRGLDTRYAGTVEGSAYTVEALLASVAETRRREAEAAVVVVEAPPGEPDDAPTPEGAPAADLPAGQGTLDCGCSAQQVVLTGVHAAGCTRRADPLAELWASPDGD
jgi:hypothetical protein